MPEGFSNTIQFLASGESPGMLQPGESRRVPIYWAGWQKPWDFSYPAINFTLSVTTADDTTDADWDSMEDDLRPDQITAEAWEAIWANFATEVGDTWGDYVRMLDENAGYLGRLGQRVVDVDQLFSFELQQANGLGPLDALAMSEDLTVEAPGMAITFERVFYGGTISDRYRLGPLGRGWSHNWDWTLQRNADGEITIIEPDGTRRLFQPKQGSGYIAASGDGSTLTPLELRFYTNSWPIADAMMLREPDGLVRVFYCDESWADDGKLVYVEDLNGNRIMAGYTGGRLTSLTHYPSDNRFDTGYEPTQWLQIEYDANGRIGSVTDPVGRQTLFTYDASGEHLMTAEQYDGRILTYAYVTGEGAVKEHALTQDTLSCGVGRYFEYDDQGRLVETHLAGGAEPVTFAYDTAGRVTLTSALGDSLRFWYDHLDRLVKMQDDLGHSVNVSFASGGQVTRISDSVGRTYTYDASTSKHLEITDPLGGEIDFAYRYREHTLGSESTYLLDLSPLEDGATELGGVLLAASGGGDGSVAITRTGFSVRLASVRDANGNLMEFDYVEDLWLNTYRGNLVTTTRADGTEASWEYDAAGNVDSWTNRGEQLIDYEYDAAGRLTAKHYPDGPSATYTYDDRGNLTTATNDYGTITFSYDPVKD